MTIQLGRARSYDQVVQMKTYPNHSSQESSISTAAKSLVSITHLLNHAPLQKHLASHAEIICVYLAPGRGKTAGLFFPSLPTALIPNCRLSFGKSTVTPPVLPTSSAWLHCKAPAILHTSS